MHTFITDSIAIFLLLTYKSYEGTIHFLASSPSKEVGTHQTQNRCLLNKWKISEAAQYFGCNQPGSISSLLCWGCSLQVFFLFNPPPNIYISLMNIKSLVLDIDCWYNPAPLYFVIHVWNSFMSCAPILQNPFFTFLGYQLAFKRNFRQVSMVSETLSHYSDMETVETLTLWARKICYAYYNGTIVREVGNTLTTYHVRGKCILGMNGHQGSHNV